MYPTWSKDDVWDICLTLLEKDSPVPGFRNALMEFKNDFNFVYERVREEHSHIKRKYYQTANKTPIVNPLYLTHYIRLIYFFSRALFEKNIDSIILDQLFFSIITRCNIDLFYEIELKKYFLPEHALGTVMGRAKYNDYLVVTQNCTIGNNKGIYPCFGKHIVLRPGATVLGNCNIGNNVHISAGSLVVDRDIPDNSIVFGRVPNLIIKEASGMCTNGFFN